MSFSLGTDTAGSGRVPAALNNIVGMKPTRGRISNYGTFPACKSLDCVSIFAKDVVSCEDVFSVLEGFDDKDPYSRVNPVELSPQKPVRDQVNFTFGVLDTPFFKNTSLNPDTKHSFESCYEEAVRRFEAIGGKGVFIDYTLFNEAAKLLYEGPWVAERYAALGNVMQDEKAYEKVKKIVVRNRKDPQPKIGFV